MRVFVAIDCNSIHQDLVGLQRNLKIPQSLFVKKFHLTLAFLGNVNSAQVLSIQEQLRKVRSSSFSLTFDHLGIFSHHKRMIVWSGIKHTTEITELKHNIDKVLGNADETFIPHVTLARMKRPQRITAKYQAITPIKQKVTCFHLIESKLTANGPKYRILETYTLL